MVGIDGAERQVTIGGDYDCGFDYGGGGSSKTKCIPFSTRLKSDRRCEVRFIITRKQNPVAIPTTSHLWSSERPDSDVERAPACRSSVS